MGKSAGERAAEKLRQKVRKEEKRQGVQAGQLGQEAKKAILARRQALVACGGGRGGGGGSSNGPLPPAALCASQALRPRVRKLLDEGDAREAARIIAQTAGPHMDVKLFEDVLACCMQVGDLRAAGLMVSAMQRCQQRISVRLVVQAVAGLSQRAEVAEALAVSGALANLCHFNVDGNADGGAVSEVVAAADLEHRVAYLRHFLPLMVSEFLAEGHQGLASGNKMGTGKRQGSVIRGVTAMPLPNGGQLRCQVPFGQPQPFQKGDSVLLTCEQHQSREYEGEVVDDGPRTFNVRVVGVPSSKPLQMPTNVTWTAVRLGYRSTFSRQLEAMRQLLEVRPRGPLSNTLRPKVADQPLCCALVQAPLPETVQAALSAFGLESICAQPPDDGSSASLARALPQARAEPTLNPSQQEAVSAALARRLTLIQGPPGTGKTHTAVRLLACWARSGARPVLACSDSNVAVDNLVEGLAAIGVNVCRVGRSESIRPDLEKYSLDSQLNATEASALPMVLPMGMVPPAGGAKGGGGGKGGGKGGYGGQYDAMQNVLRAAEVVCATCSGAGVDLLSRIAFPSLLIDEAAQATEPTVVVPIVHGAMRVCLVGDHRQLPPTIVSREAEMHGLGTSLFDRLQRGGVQRHLLRTQFRMNPGLCVYPSAAFYNSEVGSGVMGSVRTPPLGVEWPIPGVGLLFLNCSAGLEDAEGQSQLNRAEAQVVAQVIQQLLLAGEVHPGQVGVITPYAAQVRLLRQLLRGTLAESDVNSVDGFQGREKDVIVVSTVRSSAGGGVGFLSDQRRLNVTLTRGKRALIIVGNGNTLLRDAQCWGPWLQWAQGVGAVQGEEAGDESASCALAALGSGDDGGLCTSDNAAVALAELASRATRTEDRLPPPIPLPPLEAVALPWPEQPAAVAVAQPGANGRPAASARAWAGQAGQRSW